MDQAFSEEDCLWCKSKNKRFRCANCGKELMPDDKRKRRAFFTLTATGKVVREIVVFCNDDCLNAFRESQRRRHAA